MYPFHRGKNEFVSIIPFVTDSINLNRYPFENENVNDSYQIPINCAKRNRE